MSYVSFTTHLRSIVCYIEKNTYQKGALLGCDSKQPYDDMYDFDTAVAAKDPFEAKAEENIILENGSYESSNFRLKV